MKLLRWTTVFLVALACVAGADKPAFAQTADDDAAAMPTQQDDLDAFWAERRNVRVLQRRLFPTAGEFQATVYFGVIPNDPFLKYFPIGARLGYHISETIQVELGGEYIGEVFRSETDLASFLDDQGDVDVFLRDEQLWRADAMVMWSPIYGKFSFLGTKLAHFDWWFGAGMGVVMTENPVDGFLGVRTDTGIVPEAVIGTGWTIHLHERWAARVDYRQYIFQKDAGGVATPSEIGLGASFFF